MDLGGELDDDVGKGVADFLGIGDDDALTVAQDNVTRHADDGGIGRDVTEHDRAGADAAVVTNRDIAQNARAGPDRDTVSNRGMALAFFLAGPSESDPLVDSDVVAQDSGLANYHAHSVIDEETPADLSGGMDFDAGEPAKALRIETSQQAKMASPEPVADVVSPDGVKAGVAEQDLEVGASGGVALEDCGDVFAHGF